MGTASFITLPSDPHLRRWMLFVDGENFAIRGKKVADAASVSLPCTKYYEPNVFLWFPGVPGTKAITNSGPATIHVQDNAIRAYYYTSVTGDETRVLSVRERLWSIGFEPNVFKKNRQQDKAKGVDIALAKDMLSGAFLNNFDVAVLIAGDGDYVPLVEEVKRLGKIVYVAFFATNGLSLELRLSSDVFFDFEPFLRERFKPDN